MASGTSTNMGTVAVILMLAFVTGACSKPKDAVALLHELESAGDAELAARIRQLLHHYQTDDPVGLPGDPIPDPLPVPDMRRSLPIGSVRCQNMVVKGLSKFRIRHLTVEAATMKVTLKIEMEAIVVTGYYTLTNLFSRRQGDFVLRVYGVHLSGDAQMVVDRSGTILADSIGMDMGFTTMKFELENLSLLGQMVQGMVSGLEKAVFEAVKPIVLRQINHDLRSDLNKQMVRLPRRFPDSICPLDMIVADVRNQLRQEGYDPLVLPPLGITSMWSRANVTELRVVGVASLHRSGDLSVTLKDRLLTVDFDFSTGKLIGYCKWEVSLGSWLTHSGELEFTVEDLRVRATVDQPTDIRKKGTMRDLSLQVGQIQTRSSGLGTLNYLLDGVMTVVPTMITPALEEPLKKHFQNAMADIDLEELVEKHLSAFRKRVKAVKQHYQRGNSTRRQAARRPRG